MFKLLYKIGQQLRNPSIKKWVQFLKLSEKWTEKELEQYQLKRLQEIGLLAYENSPFYKAFFDQHQFHPKEIKSLEDLKKIPILTKQLVLENVENIHLNIKYKRKYKATTSGSSGNSLQFWRDESADSFNRAAILRGYSWYNVNPWDYSGYFWGFNFNTFAKFKTRFLDFLQHRFRLFTYQEKEFSKFVQKLQKASYLTGYSSMIYETAKLINVQKLPKPTQLKLVVGTSEKIYDAYQKEVEQAFGRKIMSEYGATETGIIAFECNEGKMHINMEGVLVEEVNHEIIVTNLQMESFPVIRYQLGDYVKLAPKDFKCNCGMHHRIIEEVTGRIGETIYGTKHQYPSLYCYYIFKNLSLHHQLHLNYRAEQHQKGSLEFYIEQTVSEHQHQLIVKEFDNYFKGDLELTIFGASLTKDSLQKSISFKSYLTI